MSLALWGYVVLFFVFLTVPILIVVVVAFSSASFVSFPIEGVSLRWFARFYDTTRS